MHSLTGWRPALAAVVVVLGLASIIASETIKQIGTGFADDDNDGWFTNDKNGLTVLTLSSATFSQGGQYRVIVDDVRFPTDPAMASIDNWLPNAAANTAQSLSIPVAKRVFGRNLISPVTKSQIDYSSTIKVQRLGLLGVVDDVGTATVAFNSVGGQTLTATVGSGGGTATLTFTTATTNFVDPNPNNPNGDSDGDGITESEEAVLADVFNGIGDPNPGGSDAVLIVAWTEPAFAIDPFTRELLKSRFFQRGINLHFDSGTMNGQPGSGGLMANLGVPGGVAPGTKFSVGQAATIRGLNVPAVRRRMARFALLAAGVSTGEVGRVNNIPGNVLVMQARVTPLSPNFLNYQSGVLMHELGHLLSLCHPTEHNGTLCTLIPAAEQDPGGSVMGSPAENIQVLGPLIGAPVALVNALRRPLDYSPTQWTLLTLGSGLGP